MKQELCENLILAEDAGFRTRGKLSREKSSVKLEKSSEALWEMSEWSCK